VKLQADHDALTRLHNRRSLDERLRTEFERHRRYGHPMSLLLLDIDHFKVINDTYGHQAGDAVLRELADVLRNAIRTTDFVARYGGEEFVIILPHTEEAQGHMLAERLRHCIEQCQVQHHGVQLSATVSIGVAGFRPGAFANVEELVREADRALYLAKANGRNLVCTMTGCEGAKAAG
jgi:diguanylate cyclase (GGDEF)-like protein